MREAGDGAAEPRHQPAARMETGVKFACASLARTMLFQGSQHIATVFPATSRHPPGPRRIVPTPWHQNTNAPSEAPSARRPTPTALGFFLSAQGRRRKLSPCGVRRNAEREDRQCESGGRQQSWGWGCGEESRQGMGGVGVCGEGVSGMGKGRSMVFQTINKFQKSLHRGYVGKTSRLHLRGCFPLLSKIRGFRFHIVFSECMLDPPPSLVETTIR